MSYPDWIKTHSEQRMHDDFRVFLWYVWRHLGLPQPTWIQLSIALFLQHGPRRRMVQAFRGVGKSWITAAYVLWLLYRDPQHKIMVVSASKDRADAFSIFVKRLIIEIDILGFLQPREGQRDSNLAFDVGPAQADQSPSVKSVGITGQMTGSRADTIVADDIEIPKNSATEQQREKLGEQIKEFDAILKPGGNVVYLGTPQNAQSLYGLLPARGYDLRVWPARFVGADTYAGRLAADLEATLGNDPSLLGKSTEPSRFTDLDLAEREGSYGRSGFALQFMLDTSLNDANRYPLRLRDLIVMAVDPKIAPSQVSWASGPEQVIQELPNVGLNGDRYHRPMYHAKDFVAFDGSVMVVDPAGRGKDETAYCVVKMLKGMLYVRKWGGLSGGYDQETLETLATIAKEESVNEIRIEANFGDGMFTSLFSPVLTKIYPVTLEEYKVTGQKEARILDKLEPIMNQHRLVMDYGVCEKHRQDKYSGFYQMTHLTRDRGSLRHDDRIDCLAEAVGYFVQQIGNDVNQAEQQHRTSLLLKDLHKHQQACRVLSGRPGRKSMVKL